MYQSPSGSNLQNRFIQSENMNAFGYAPQSMNEKELAGYSEQIMSSQGIPPSFIAQQQLYAQNAFNNPSQDSLGTKSFQQDPNASIYATNINMSSGMPYPPNVQASQQVFGANTFGSDPNMSNIYGGKPRADYPQSPEHQNLVNVNPYGNIKNNDFDFLNDKLIKVQQMYDTLKKEYDEQKQFYDDALEARTNQLEEAETEASKLKADLELSRKTEIDLQSKNESCKFDNEMLTKRIETTCQDKTNASQREEGLLKQLDELNTALKQKESIIEQKVDENFGLKQTIDGLKNEGEKYKRRIEALEEVLRGKDAEISSMERDNTE